MMQQGYVEVRVDMYAFLQYLNTPNDVEGIITKPEKFPEDGKVKLMIPVNQIVATKNTGPFNKVTFYNSNKIERFPAPIPPRPEDAYQAKNPEDN